VQEGFTADLIIVIRKGNGKLIQPTIGGTPVNGTPPVSGARPAPRPQSRPGGPFVWALEAQTIPRAPEISLPLPSRKSRLALRGIRSSFIAAAWIRSCLHSMPRRYGGIQLKMRSHRLRFQRSKPSES
jgi:hypothetical protein